VWQTIWNHRDLQGVLDASPSSDVDTARTIVKLMDAGYVTVE
jgi:hypothetical protein